MHTLVIGVGYTGQRVLDLLSGEPASGLGRPGFDLDRPPPQLPTTPQPCAVLYTVPPRSDTPGDQEPRLHAFLSLLKPLPQRFVYLSTTGVYGDASGRMVDESRPPAPATDRARRRLAAEFLLTRWCAENDVNLLILRVPGIYGPGRLGIDRLSRGIPVIVESEAHPGNRIHVDDLAACCLRALDSTAPAGIYNVGDGDHRSSSWFSRKVAALAGLDAPAEISRAMAESSLSQSALSFLRESRIVDTHKMRSVLGFTPRFTDPENGIKASLPRQNAAGR